MTCEYGICPIRELRQKIERLRETEADLYRDGYENSGNDRDYLDQKIAQAQSVQQKIDDLLREKDSFVACSLCTER